MNELIASLEKRLGGGLHGDLYEEGSRLDDRNRHGQLETVFALKKELSDMKTQMEKKANATGPSEDKGGKAPAKANTNLVATIKNVVQEQLSGQLRDLAVRIERLDAPIKKAEDQDQGLKNRVKALEAKLKKAEERNQRLTSRLESVEYQEPGLVLEGRLGESEERNEELADGLERAEDRIGEAEDRMKAAEDTMTEAENKIKRVNSLRHQLEEIVYANGDNSNEDQESNETRLNALELKQRQHSTLLGHLGYT